MRKMTLWVLLCLVSSVGHGWESSAPKTRGISDQGNYPYCSFHSMATFLESWGNRPYSDGSLPRPLPSLDPAYLALATNLEATNGAFWLNSLVIIAAKYGVIPKGAAPVDGQKWPMKNWEKRHRRLLGTRRLRPLVTGKYEHKSVEGSFTGTQYLDRQIGIDFGHFRWVRSTYEEPFYNPFFDLFAGFEFSPKKKKEKTHTYSYRQGSRSRMNLHLMEEAKKLGIQTTPVWRDYPALFAAIRNQLNRDRPVLLSIFTGRVANKFSDEGLMTKEGLSEYGQGDTGKHAIVAVAHCNRWESKDRVCRRFAGAMREKNVSECVALQNSWGLDSHTEGFTCISKKALRPLLNGAILTEFDLQKTALSL